MKLIDGNFSYLISPACNHHSLDVTYLQAFYFSLETMNVVFHVAAVEAFLALLLRCGWTLSGLAVVRVTCMCVFRR